jgi:hypothetical protein
MQDLDFRFSINDICPHNIFTIMTNNLYFQLHLTNHVPYPKPMSNIWCLLSDSHIQSPCPVSDVTCPKFYVLCPCLMMSYDVLWCPMTSYDVLRCSMMSYGMWFWKTWTLSLFNNAKQIIQFVIITLFTKFHC